ncbi:hypothetical protein [Mesorhizobium sp. INR15]|uniref:hypothetical protein n=1 Tax=Mesorhizobium sp. INR15 TaxID=2654248 RepID=UPI0018966C28|nr:hypothetical protein [Mesorhizobium sp. INR15]QPC95861.1 hypothetical protein GA829_35590 [Mesorhizobium sp. INR15]
MKQILLALVLIAVPAAAFTGYQVYAKSTPVSTAGLGDLTAFKTIITDVEAFATKGDLAGAAARITDYESAWDHGQTAIRPLNPTYWGNVDEASDAALKALREASPSADKVKKTLDALMAALSDPSQPVQ